MTIPQIRWSETRLEEQESRGEQLKYQSGTCSNKAIDQLVHQHLFSIFSSLSLFLYIYLFIFFLVWNPQLVLRDCFYVLICSFCILPTYLGIQKSFTYLCLNRYIRVRHLREKSRFQRYSCDGGDSSRSPPTTEEPRIDLRFPTWSVTLLST